MDWTPHLSELRPLATIAPADVEALLDAAFGTDRHRRTAYRVRVGLQPIGALSLARVEGDRLTGCIQCWPVQLNTDDGRAVPMVMVGPVAVAPDRQGTGIGQQLMAASIAAAGDDAPLMLIGDPEYYGRFFGFDAAATASWRLPGPVERHRLLARGADLPTIGGVLGPRRHAAAVA